MSDIVERLKNEQLAVFGQGNFGSDDLGFFPTEIGKEAATEIERLHAEADRSARLVADIRIKFPEVDAWLLSEFQKRVAEGLAIIEKGKP